MVRSMLQKSPKDRVVPLASMASMAFFNGGNPNHSLTGIFSPSKFPYHPCMVYIYPILVDLYGKCEGKYTIHGWCGHDIGFLQQFFHLQGLVEYETKLADGTSEVLKGSCWNCFQKSLGFIWAMKKRAPWLFLGMYIEGWNTTQLGRNYMD